MKFDFRKGLFILFVVLAIVVSTRVYGLSTLQLGIIDNILFVLVVILIVVIIAIAYRRLLSKVLAWVDDTTEDGTKSSAFPIMSFFGNTSLVLGCLYVIMNHFGVDLVVIVTSLGLVGLAISFGAQSTLQQFFSGIGMMMARTVKAGDIVRLDSNPTRLVVRSIGVMTTTFSSFENEEIITMPNNTLASSTVTNLTGESGSYCLELHMQFRISTVDLDELAETIEKSLDDVKHVITDGSLPYPHLQYYGLEGGTTKCKFLVYVDDYHYHDETYSIILRRVVRVLKDHGMGPNGGMGVYLGGGQK
ncbi:MAG: mechanosensitive ion channel family protein [archaeon]|nr:mechanosensitive ion channel family protein [archaeon]